MTSKRYQYLNHHNLSLFHDVVSHGVQLLYVDDLQQSIQFYSSIGFRTVFRDSIICVLRMKHIYIERWNNRSCQVALPDASPLRESAHRSLHIEIPGEDDLKGLHALLDRAGTEIEYSCWDSASPFGVHFCLRDPDHNSVAFCSGRNWSNQSLYERECQQLVEDKLSSMDFIQQSLREEA